MKGMPAKGEAIIKLTKFKIGLITAHIVQSLIKSQKTVGLPSAY